MLKTRHLTDTELAAAIHNRKQGEASLACEGMYLAAEEKALFDRLEADRLPHDECLRQVLEFSRSRRRSQVTSAP